MSTSTFSRLMHAAAIGLLLATGCATPPIKVEPIPLSENPSDQIESLNAELTTARLNELHLLAPESFAAAVAAHRQAQKGLAEGAGVAAILKQVAIGRAQLDRARERAKVTETILAEPLEARRLALKAGAIEFGRDYLDVEDQLVELTTGVENERLDWASKRSGEVTARFKDLELRAIKRNAIGEARRLLNEAEKTNADDIAPATFAQARQTLQETESYIDKNRYQSETIAAKAEQALFQAQRLWQISDQSRKLKEMRPEQAALWIEELLARPAGQLGIRDLRNLPFDEQSTILKASISDLQEGKEAQRSQIEEARQQIASLEGQTREEQAEKELYIWEQKAAKEKLERERRFQQLFNEVQALFGHEEAEVYKQGNHLVIRLRSIRFPVGQSVILPDNYPLLGKVRRAIQTFGEPAVTIEGHTDSTGTDQANASLSQSRAEAVRQFFVANGALPGERVIAVGYGSRRPLAPNTTAEGRAINRRIDVIITPQAQDNP